MGYNLSGQMSNALILSGSITNAILRGYSAYELAVQQGFEGTQEEWLESLKSKISIRVVDHILQWKYIDETEWNDIYDLSPDKNYENQLNKPKINNVELIGNKPLSDFGIQEEITEISATEIANICR